MDPVAAAKKQLSSHFGPMVEDMWRGGYKTMRPGSFKTALGERHPQFKGSMQHDCQEFLALLLDTLHDELMAARFGCDMKCPAGGPAPLLFQANSSMEMNAAESAQMDDEDAASAAAGGGGSAVKAADDAAVATSAAAAPEATCRTTCAASEDSARESESASPKSFDSHSSIGKGNSERYVLH